MAELTFRDFAAAIMRSDEAGAATVLETLLGLPADAARAATVHFRAQMPDPAFMPKAMGLRTAITSGTDADVSSLLADCFALDDAQQRTALATLRARYGAG
ncbi:MAG: hypothetical protein R3B48_12965 [Kofleriaceae bacterium]